MLKSLRLNGYNWKCSLLGGRALLLEPDTEKDDHLNVIHQTVRLLEAEDIPDLTDIIPAYQSIALLFDNMITEIEILTNKLESIRFPDQIKFTPVIHQVPICYELGLDWNEVQELTGLTKENLIELHLHGEYTLAMLGFMPGFVFLSGLSEKAQCARKKNPRTKIPAGSVGIGGRQTGIYSLESPGGWQIIGRTPVTFFNVDADPPVSVKPGDKLFFHRITESEFNNLKNRADEGIA